MLDPRLGYMSAYRNLRTVAKPVMPPSVPSPTGAQTSTTAAGQAQALRARAAPAESAGVWGSLPGPVRQQLQDEYSRGGFDAVKNVEGWFDVPEHVRRQILTGLTTL